MRRRQAWFRQVLRRLQGQVFFSALCTTRPSRGGRCGLLEGSDGDERWLVRFGGSGNRRAGGSGHIGGPDGLGAADNGRIAWPGR